MEELEGNLDEPDAQDYEGPENGRLIRDHITNTFL